MTKLLENLRQTILNSYIYIWIASFCKWASGAYFFTPDVYGYYKPRREMASNLLLVKGLHRVSNKLEGLFKSIREAFFDSLIITLAMKVEQWLLKSVAYRLVRQFNVVYLLILYVYVDKIIRTYVGGVASIWDELLMIVFLGIIIIKRILFNKRYNVNNIDLSIFTFISVYTGIMFIYSPDLNIGIEGLRAVVQYMIWYFLIVQLIDTDELVERVLFLSIVSIGLLGFHGTYQYITGAEMLGNWVDSSETVATRAYSIVGGPNTLGSLLVLFIPIGFGTFLVEKDILKKLIYIVMTIGMGLGLIFTFSRGAWLAVFIAVIVFIAFVAKRMIVSITTLLLTVVLSVDTLWDRIYNMFTKEYIAKASSGGRLYRWNFALEKWSESKLLGLGIGRFGGAVATNHNLTPFYMDNYYLKTLTESGIIGLTAFVLLQLSTLVNMFLCIVGTTNQRYRIIMFSIFSGLIGLLVHNGVENIFEAPFSLVYYWTMVGVLVAMYKIDKNGNNKSELQDR